ncbi:carbohydrate porin [Asticcacaulis sp. 201]|uniref:carbohydrate porin n=1 Tax=Asticcacaulis sp. 201 TaxID=3028787 RepID=UPI0029170448|nr:carbohydrate porin [Asticcacaulis sp. 201]MDV6331218.1 carbohydrate porin [Asticcacaulis sp. 201]
MKYDFYRPEPESDRGVSGWIRAGKANHDIQSIESYLGGGLVWTGPSASRASDAVGFAVAHADFGRPYVMAAGMDLKPEITLELTYRYAISDGLAVQPDVQYIRHPSGDPQVDDALVVGARLKVGLAAFK